MNQSIDWVFGFLWWGVSTIAIFVGGFVALYIGFFIGGQVGLAIDGTIEGVAGYIAFWVIVPLILTAIVGVAQGWLLREYLPIVQWFGATLAGGAVGAAITVGVGLLHDRSIGTDIASLAAWTGTALTQWVLLRRFSTRSIVWLIAGAVQIPIALAQPNPMISIPPIVILVYAIVTAILIVWVLQTAQTRSME